MARGDGAVEGRILVQGGEGRTEIRKVHSKVPADQADGYRQGWIDYY